MWVKCKIVDSDERILYLPPSLIKKDQNQGWIIFGGQRTCVTIQPFICDDGGRGKSYDQPIELGLNKETKEKILIPETITYQMKISGNEIILGPVIGFLLGEHNHRYHPRHMEKYLDRFDVYPRIGGLIYAFSPNTIDWNKGIVYGLYYNPNNNGWVYGRFPLPTVVYRRNFHTESKTIDRLIKFTDNRLFNSYRFSKSQLYEYVNEHHQLSQYLPPTRYSHSPEQLKTLLDQEGKIILKPSNLSRGRGICVVEKTSSSYKVTDYRNKTPYSFELGSRADLEQYLRSNPSFFEDYLAQKYINLATIDGQLFDIRVVMQKGVDGFWNCTGVECRVAGMNSHLTNISRGGYALPLPEALDRAFPGDKDNGTLIEEIYSFCQQLSVYLDSMEEHYAEFGLDIGVDEGRNIWLIEANVFPSFKGFKSMDYNIYKLIRYNPLLYAASLTQFKPREEGSWDGDNGNYKTYK